MTSSQKTERGPYSYNPGVHMTDRRFLNKWSWDYKLPVQNNTRFSETVLTTLHTQDMAQYKLTLTEGKHLLVLYDWSMSNKHYTCK